MRRLLIIFLSFPSFLLSNSIGYKLPVVKAQYFLAGNTFSTSIWNTGIFNQNLGADLAPSLQWPQGSGKFVGLSAGMCFGAYYNGGLRISNATYTGEYSPGYVINGGGVAIAKTSVSFHVYKVNRGDDCQSNPDYCNWYLMEQQGAPYDDVNNNGHFDIGIDIPGMKNAAQTIFVCITDGFSENHSIAEGFSGGTAPLYAQIGMTIWNYDNPGYEDMQFIKYRFINKSLVEWKKSYFSLFVHPQIGDSLDDYVGCDTIRRMGYVYNRDNIDGSGAGNSYGTAPPAAGMTLLDHNDGLGMTSFHYTIPPQLDPSPFCEEFPYTPAEAYNLMKGNKKDNTPWLDPTASPPKLTKYTFPGDPESGAGWTEYNGVISNCNGAVSGPVTPNYSIARTFMMSTGSDDYNLPCPAYIQFFYAQLVARGSNNKNSVTKLKQLSDKAQQLFNHNFIIGINPISSIIPEKFSLYQNYPNPFNPSTKIKFDLTKSEFTSLKIFDITGKEMPNLVNENLKAGTYEINFSAQNLPSGIYFYQLKTNSFTETKKMTLVK